ncbi:C40 family peptidase [Paenibacillus sp. ACRRX]|uniref:C40 family peptidase n=1 Tax=unclassified Paenibacillus TaxID=185978 RepID=UPI001EF46035|nr:MULTISPECIES: C40 family peptidase [unclassified Paenibacillus]MCG7407202.1 C40 family peptidase [Paenibacillus sp. ACRRX]MDK8180422.1 C40 family peptidase [Paenibacillus sp. UMB4589-SE434]
MNKVKFGKLLVCVSLSASFLFAGSVVAPLQSAEAATITSSSKANQIIATGKKYMGVRYKFGAATGQTRSFDCSSFTQYIFKKHGIKLPRDSRQQSKVGHAVKKSQLKKGDLIFFYSPIHHVAVYMGNGKILHTYGKPGVTVSKLSTWNSRITKIRRVL